MFKQSVYSGVLSFRNSDVQLCDRYRITCQRETSLFHMVRANGAFLVKLVEPPNGEGENRHIT